MKKIRMLLASIMMLCSITANAWIDERQYDFELNGIYYKYCDDYGNDGYYENNTVMVSYVRYQWNDFDGNVQVDTWYSGDVVIPETVNNGETFTVIGISDFAFYNCSTLESVTIPKTVKFIKEGAFEGCSGLRLVNITDIASWCRIETGWGNPLYYADHLYLNGEEVKDLVIPDSVTEINDYVFYGCKGLTSLKIPSSVRCIEQAAFAYCSGLTSVTFGDGIESISYSAFADCTSLTSIIIPKSVNNINGSTFSGCSGLSSIIVESENKIYDSRNNCNAIIETASNTLIRGCVKTVIPNSVTSLGDVAFSGCSELTSIDIPNNVTSIGSSAFSYCSNLITVYLNATSPLKITSSYTFGSSMVLVPTDLFDEYKTMEYWSDINAAGRLLTTADKVDYDINVTAKSTTSGMLSEIKVADLSKVVKLKISGSINSYDIIVLNQKMPFLRYLDLTDANILKCNHEYYTGYMTQNNVVGSRMFYSDKFKEIKLPKTARSIADEAFYNCKYGLESVVIPSSIVSIGNKAFQDCYNLRNIIIPDNVRTIGDYAFKNCNITSINIPNSVLSIGREAFYNCDLVSVSIGNQLNRIGQNAFYGCDELKTVKISDIASWCRINIDTDTYTYRSNPLYYAEIIYFNGEELKDLVIPNSVTEINSEPFRYCKSLISVTIPSSVKTISENAFSGCKNLEKVYTRTIEPTDINQNTFSSSTYSNATLYVPKTSYNLYWLDPAWSQFKNLAEYDAPYDNFYVNNDYVLDDETGNVQGTPDVDVEPGSGFIHEGSEDQDLDDVHVKDNGTTTGSIIGNGHIDAAKLFFDIAVNKNKWYFFCFPYKAMLSDMKHSGEYVWRKYDGNKRANSGGTGWADMTTDCLYQGEGYIYQTNVTGSLSVEILKEQFGKFEGKDINITLTAYNSSNANNASWNLIGNPFTSYYDINDMGYNAPITIWNGSSYVAIRPGDDDYILRPFEAFFVQKSNETSEIEFKAEFRLTYNQSQVKMNKVAMKSPADSKRFVVNLTISDGENSDKTRVVFNEKQNNAYEIGCDAAKFMSTESVPQLYTLDSKNVKYSINERPEGEVAMGYVANKEGQYTISAVRMDKAVMLKDLERGVIHDLSTGDYTFASEVGTFEGRFVLMLNSDVTGIDDIKSQTGVEVAVVNGGISISGAAGKTVTIYNVGGAQVAANVTDGVVALASGTYIVTVDGVSTKVVVL